MKFFVIALLVFVVLPGSLFAQGGGGGTTAGGATAAGEGLSAQGGFIGVGQPIGFVGVHEIYNRTTGASRTSTARQTTAVRPRTTVAATAAQRRPGTMLGGAQFGNLGGNQAIRSTTSPDFAPTDFNSGGLSMQRPLPTIEMGLTRIQGMRDSRVSLTDSPTGTKAVLTGSVSSERERRVAQQLLLLEPGINRVENLLEIR